MDANGHRTACGLCGGRTDELNGARPTCCDIQRLQEKLLSKASLTKAGLTYFFSGTLCQLHCTSSGEPHPGVNARTATA
ncbi:hypothetical protein GCM10009741_11520 [Kribbella lupini]|uniref:Uncharacterized protein n=1 Tax=Kribbella lupini TaxID=291602 RepID=A0ABN2AAZ6_9ACTN